MRWEWGGSGLILESFAPAGSPLRKPVIFPDLLKVQTLNYLILESKLMLCLDVDLVNIDFF